MDTAIYEYVDLSTLVYLSIWRVCCRAKPKGSICLLDKKADTAFWLCRSTTDVKPSAHRQLKYNI